VPQQALAVDRDEAFKRIGRRRDSSRGERPRDEHGGAVADHAANALFGQRYRSARFEQRVRRLGNVAARIDQCAVEIEDDE
jgi:hypothetical protein